MCAVKLFFLSDRILKLGNRAGWFDRKHVETGTNTTILHRLDQSVLIDNFAASRVDEITSRSHRAEDLTIDCFTCVRIKCRMNTDDICGCCDLLWRSLVFNSQRRCSLWSKASAPGNDRHSKRSRPRNHFLTNLTQPDESESSAKQTTCF